jgi:hypothetical protein
VLFGRKMNSVAGAAAGVDSAALRSLDNIYGSSIREIVEKEI